LYAEYSKLGYDVNNMSRSPRAPFDPSDSGELGSQSLRVAESAVGLHAKDPSELNYAEVTNVLIKIRRVQGYYDTINYTNDQPEPKNVIYSAVENTINMVNSL
jgi:hypothetical protein